MNGLLTQTLQITGSLLILAAFGAAQAGWLRHTCLAYLIPNAAGSAILAAFAISWQQWGFVLLEGTWAAISLAGAIRILFRAISSRRPLASMSRDLDLSG